MVLCQILTLSFRSFDGGFESLAGENLGQVAAELRAGVDIIAGIDILSSRGFRRGSQQLRGR